MDYPDHHFGSSGLHAHVVFLGAFSLDCLLPSASREYSESRVSIALSSSARDFQGSFGTSFGFSFEIHFVGAHQAISPNCRIVSVAFLANPFDSLRGHR